MSALTDLTKRLRAGEVYRRKELARWSKAVDRHLQQLLQDGRLEKVGPEAGGTLGRGKSGIPGDRGESRDRSAELPDVLP